MVGDRPAEGTEGRKEGFVIKNDGGFADSGSGEIVYKDEGKAGIMCDRTFIDAVLTGDGPGFAPLCRCSKVSGIYPGMQQVNGNRQPVMINFDK